MKFKNLVISMSLLLAQPTAVYAENVGSNAAGNIEKKISDNSWQSDQHASNSAWDFDNTRGLHTEGKKCLLHYLSDLKQYERVEFIDNSYIDANNNYQKVADFNLIVERYDTNFQFIKSKRIPFETYRITGSADNEIKWGGAYSGKEWNFVVTAQDNLDQDPNKEVIRITRYTKEWEYSDYIEISNGEVNSFFDSIYEPFDYGTNRMAEINGQLWLHFSRTMYKADDGLHHQANYNIKIDEKTMKLLYKGDVAYVSHSFDQFIQTYDHYVYTVDLGDGYPRAVCLQQIDNEGEYFLVITTYWISMGK